jgi:hypothetical protein
MTKYLMMPIQNKSNFLAHTELRVEYPGESFSTERKVEVMPGNATRWHVTFVSRAAAAATGIAQRKNTVHWA